MKLVKNLVFSGLLVFAVTFNTFAGEMETPASPIPGPTPPAPKLVIDEGTTPISDPYTGEKTTDLFYEALAALLSVY